MPSILDAKYPLNNWVGGELLKLVSYERNKNRYNLLICGFFNRINTLKGVQKIFVKITRD